LTIHEDNNLNQQWPSSGNRSVASPQVEISKNRYLGKWSIREQQRLDVRYNVSLEKWLVKLSAT